MANQEEVRDVYGYFEQNGNALCYRYEAERVRIEPWGENSLRVRAWKTADMDPADWALLPLKRIQFRKSQSGKTAPRSAMERSAPRSISSERFLFTMKRAIFFWRNTSATGKICLEIPAVPWK